MIEYTLIRSKRKSITIEVDMKGEILVRAPKWTPKYEIDAFLFSKEDWINKSKRKMQAKRESMLAQGHSVETLTEEELKALTKSARKEFKALVQKWEPIVLLWRPDLKKPEGRRVAIRHQSTMWGSCSGKGNLNFNCLLMLAPPEVREYVVVHELCHLIHMDHSKDFWWEVEKSLPNYKKPRKWLKDNGGVLLNRLP